MIRSERGKSLQLGQNFQQLLHICWGKEKQQPFIERGQGPDLLLNWKRKCNSSYLRAIKLKILVSILNMNTLIGAVCKLFIYFG